MVILIAKLAVYQSSSVILDNFTERIVNRLHNHHGISLFGKCSYAGSKCIDNPSTKCYPLRFDRISITCGEPMVHCCKIFIQWIGITKDSMIDPLVKFIQNLIRKTKIHVCHPERKQVISSLPFHSEIIFQAVRSMSVDYFIKIVFSHVSAPLYFFFVSYTAFSMVCQCFPTYKMCYSQYTLNSIHSPFLPYGKSRLLLLYIKIPIKHCSLPQV